MRVSCIILVLAVFLSSTLAWPKGYDDRDEQKNTITAILQHLLSYVKGIQTDY